MITCAYCCYGCPDSAQICPKCGNPIIRLPVDDTPNYDDIAKKLLRENNQEPKEPLTQKHAIIAASVVLLLALVVYTIISGK